MYPQHWLKILLIMVLSSVQVRSARAVEDLQRKELEDQLEAEAYFSGLYKTQVQPATPFSIFFWIRVPYPFSE
jgi:hypothetical protein